MKFRVLILLICSTILAHGQQSKDLSYYLESGVKNSPLLWDNFNQIEAARIDSLKIRATQYPQINLFANVMRAPLIKGYGYDETITNGSLYTGGIQASFPLLNGKIIRAEYDNISIQRNALKNSSRVNKHDLEKQIIDQYLETYQNFQQISFTSKVVGTLTTETAVLKEIYQKGVGKQSDYMSVSIELQAQQIQLANFKTQYKTNILLLNSLCAITDTQTVNLTAPDLKLKNVSNLFSSPFYYKFYLDSLALESQRRIASAKYLPHMNVYGDAGLNSSYLPAIYQTFGFSIGVNLLMPIYDGSQKKLNFEKLDMGQQTRKRYQDYFQRKYNLQIAQINAEIVSNEQIIVQLQQQKKDVEILLKLTRQQLINGIAGTADYVLALRNDLDITNNLNLALIKRQFLINENNYWTW